MIDVGSVRQEYIGDDALILVLAIGLKCDFLPEHELRCRLLRSRAVGLAFLRAVDAAEPDTFSAVVVQNFDGVAVKDGDHLSRKISSIP